MVNIPAVFLLREKLKDKKTKHKGNYVFQFGLILTVKLIAKNNGFYVKKCKKSHFFMIFDAIF